MRVEYPKPGKGIHGAIPFNGSMTELSRPVLTKPQVPDLFNKPGYVMSIEKYLTDLVGPVISTYTRKNAIEDGLLVPVSELYPNDTVAFKYPVCFSNTVASAIEGENMGAWVWDICFMAAKGPGKYLDPSTKIFTVILPAKKGSDARKTYKLKCVVGPGDNHEPVVTICLPSED